MNQAKANSLYIHNFGPIKDMRILDKRLMLFIGSQGTGKSTLAKLWTIFHDEYWWYQVYAQIDPLSVFREMGIANYFNADTSLEYTSGQIIVRYDNLSGFTISHEVLGKDQLANFFVELFDEPLQKLNLKVDEPHGGKHCYIPAERNMGAMMDASMANILKYKIPLSSPLLDFMALTEKAKASTADFDIDFLGVKYVKRDGPNILVDEAQQKYLWLYECSSGIQSSLPLVMALEYAVEEEAFDRFVVEEPEQNLFPVNQRELLYKLVSFVRCKADNSMLINTHSPYLLSALNNCILAHRLAQREELKEEVCAIIPAEFHLSADEVGVYAMGYSEDDYCHDLMDKKTGLIEGNFLDSASEIIGADFHRLYKLLIKSLKNHGK